MKTDTPQTIHLKDYTPPAFLVDTVDLDFVIETGATTVSATLAVRRNPGRPPQPLVLDGEELETLRVAVDGEKVPFSVTPNTMTTVIRIGPDKNPLLRPLPFQGRIFPKNLRAVQLLPGHTKLENTVGYPGIEVDNALEIPEQTGT